MNSNLKKSIAGLGAAAALATGGTVVADNQINPYTDTGTAYTMPITADIPQKDHIEISKDTPAVTLSRWNDEEKVTITPKFHGPGKASKASRSLLSKQMKFKKGNETVFVEPAATSSDFDIDFTLDAKPTSNVFQYQFSNADDLDFFYQPALNEEKDNAQYSCTATECVDASNTPVIERPENVVGSYAVYSKTKQNHAEGQTNYGTGKLFHIYRPKVTDANGSSTWATLDYKNDMLSVTVPQEFLESATYPVTVDPTFGYTSQGASLIGLGNKIAAESTTGAAGTLNSLSVWMINGGGGRDIKLGVYAASDSSLVFGGTTQFSPSGSATLVTETSGTGQTLSTVGYYLTAWGSCGFSCTTPDVYYDSGGTGGTASLTYTTSWPSTMPTLTADTNKYSIYATYASTFPVVGSVTSQGFASSVTSMAVSLPSCSVGQLLITTVEVRNAGTWTNPTGWSDIASQTGGGSVGKLSAFYHICDGSEGSTATWTASTATTAIWQVRVITSWNGTTPPEATTASGDVSAADPPSLTPSWGSDNTLWIAVAGHSAASTAAWSAGPSGYSDFLDSGASSGGAAVSLGSSYLQSAEASEDPGAFTVSGSNRFWAAMTIAIAPASSGGGGTSSFKPDDGLVIFE